MTTTHPPAPASASEQRLTIGTVRDRLRDEFPDISISKIRYLEDQGLLSPRRTQGGYRLFSEEDVERLRRILELQRDEFLPLRVIRQELLSPTGKERRRRRTVGLTEPAPDIDLAELCERARVAPDLVRELEDFGLIERRGAAGDKAYTEGDVEIASAAGRLARYGVSPRHLRTFRTAADRESGLLEAVVAPALRSRNSERRQTAVEDLQELGDAAQELAQLLFWRALRQLTTT
jgi:DNA-binding transcriptional MerR regulator